MHIKSFWSAFIKSLTKYVNGKRRKELWVVKECNVTDMQTVKTSSIYLT